MHTVQKIACVNNAGFVMSFGINIFDLDQGIELCIEDLDSGDYPIDQTRTIDLATTGITEGKIVRPQVHAVWGRTNTGSHWVTYGKNGQTATFEVKGTTLHYGVNLIGE